MKNYHIDYVRKKITDMYERISTSYHEGGHCIYGLLHNFKIPEVNIFYNKESERTEGMTYFQQKYSDKEKIDSLNEEICFYYAGCISEQIHLKKISGGIKMPMVLKEGSYEDNRLASSLISKFNIVEVGVKRKKYKEKLKKKTEDKLIYHWDAVEAISHNLLKKGKLNYSQIKEILLNLDDSSSRFFWKTKLNKIDSMF